VQDTGSSGEPWLQVYPAAISYTGVQGSGGFYQVVFTLDDGQQRADRFSTGRPGFKVFTRKRLNRVDVLAGGSLVRSYLLAYQQGDFDKSLLASVAVTGQDGTTVLSQHQFTYQHANAAFGPPETWGGIGGAHDATDSFNLGGSFHVYAGIGPPECIPLVGVQAGGSVSGTTELLSFVDVNGDGLPDRIDNQGHVDLNQQGSFASTSASGVSDIGRTLEFGFDLNAGFRADLEGLLPVTGGFSFVYTHANEDRTLVDINGDGFPDWVAADGSFRTSLNNGTSFSPAASWGGFGAGGLSLGMAGEQQDVLSNLQLANTLRKLVLPFTGPVSLGGAVQKKQAGGDGVTAEIWQNGNQVWQRTFAAGDTAPCLPAAGGGCGGGFTLNVQAGDRLYFLSGSIRDTDSDALLWAPQVTYTAGDPAAQEPWGPQVYQFDGGADFRLAGPPAVAWVATADGTAEVQGAIVKQVTSDDVTVTVVQNGNTASPVYQRTFAAAEVGSFAEVPPVGVAAKDKLTFRVSSQTPVDPNLVQWTPQVALGGNQPQAVQPFYDTVARLAPTDQPTVSWPVPASWDQTLHVSWAPGGAAATLYVQAPQSLLGRTALPASATTFDLPVQAATGQPLFVTVLAPDASSLGTLSVTGNGGAVPVNQRYPAPASKEPLSGGWHGWYYGEWNGNKPFSEGGLALPQSQSAGVPDFTPAVPNWQGTTGFALAAWTGSGFDLYQAAEGVKPSRQGGNAAGNLDLAMGTSAGGGLNVVRKTTGKSVGVDVSAGLNLAVSLADNQTEVDLLDMNGDRYPDQVTGSGVRFSNGRDGFGDLQPFPGLNSAVRLTKDANVTTGIGLGTTFSKKSGGGKPKGVVSTMPSVGSTVALSQTRYDLIDVNGDGLPDLVTMGSGATAATVQLNLGYRFGAPETWPLPAWNTGSGGGPGSCTDLVGIAAGGIASLISDRNSPNALNFTRSSALQAGVAIGPFGASASTTLARTLVAMIDVNGDGLPDHVSKEQGEPFFRVKLNHGDGWDPEQLWPVPDWNTTLGDGYVIPGSLQCLDAVSYTGNIASDASLGFQDCLVLVPPVPVVGLDLEITGQVLGSGGGLQLFFQDLDGDGLPDHVLKKPNDPNVYVKRNLATQANLLTAVQRPLGGSFQLSYRRQGNRVGLSDDGSHKVDMPETQWVLASVTVNDGRGNAYTTGYEYFNDAYTDRTERESYGYARVRTTRPDGSTIDRRYQNQDLYQRRLLAHEAIADASGRLFRTEDLAYQLRPLGPGAFFPARVFEQTSFFEGAAGAGKVTSRTWDYDGFGNIISFQDAGDGAAADQVVASTAYFVDPQLYVIQPSQLVVRDGNGALLRQRSATYNAQGDLASLQQVLIGGKDPASGSPYTGNSNAVFSYSYDAFGNMASVADPSGYTRTFAYDPVAKTWPARVTDSFGYSSSFAWNLLYGKVASTVDENGQLEQRTYDLFGRMASVVGPYDSSASPALTFEYFPAASPPLAVVHQKDVTRSATIDSVVFVDGIERTVETKVSAELDQGSGTATSTGMRVSGHLDFDALGRVAGRGQPVFDSGATRSFVAVAARNPTLFAYDVLDRTVQASFPNGAVTRMSYGFGTLDGVQWLAHTRTDPKGRATIFYDDVRGNVRGVQQTNTGATLLTRYAYDALSQLTAVTDARGNATSLQYDTLGRRVLQQNPDSGTTELRYTPAGDLGAKISANLAAHAQQIRYLRTFHRLDGINYPDLPPAVFTYGAPGAPGNTANRLAASSDGSGTEQLTYGRLGEIVQSVRTPVALNGDTPRGPYATRFQFDSFQRLLSLTYPDGEQVTYTFDAGGQVKKATGVVGGAPFDYLHHQGYDEFGDRVRSVYGNGVETRLSYDPLSRELAGIGTTEASGRPIQMLSYQRDLTGTVLGLANSMAQGQGHQLGGPLTETFTYDGLDQLVSAAGSLRTPPNQVSSF
ncbi:MAG TPA: toxin TcdB middle/N-terminal domain-containing protein, partial [Thermoanaerobaculia bacterium]|nr:toxin TcdB middle/N-terminal domain-containing protein [Thermoanaerobaculia bacterium]